MSREVGGPEETVLVVVGDVMLDIFMFGRSIRNAPDVPVPVVLPDHEQIRPSGAALTAVMVRALGVDVRLVGVVGSDSVGERLGKELLSLGISTGQLLLTEAGRPTTCKTSVFSNSQPVCRIDSESLSELSPKTEAELIHVLAGALHKADVLLISDYRKGVCTKAVVTEAIRIARNSGTPILVDSKNPDLDRYRGASLYKPNRNELERAWAKISSSTSDVRTMADGIREHYGFQTVVATQDSDGCYVSHSNSVGWFYAAPPVPDVVDVSGAGDVTFAALGMAFARRLPLSTAIEYAIRVGSDSVGRRVDKWRVSCEVSHGWNQNGA